MSNFKRKITQHAITVNALKKSIYETVATRDRSQIDATAWPEACSKFHEFRSEVSDLLDQVSKDTLANDEAIRVFVFDFIAVDPFYFRSGYIKERLLELIKPLDLTEHEKRVLRQTILQRVRTRALREFRRFCRLIPTIQTEGFVKELRTASRSPDSDMRRRALFALGFVTD